MTTAREPASFPESIGLEDVAEGRTFTFAEIADELGGSPDSLRPWFNGGGLALSPPFDEVAERGGRGVSHRLHWRTTVLLLLALKLNAFGFGLKNGEAAQAAGGAFKAGLELAHLCSEDSPLIAVERDAEGNVRVSLVRRDGEAGLIERPMILDGFAGVGTLLVDPIGLGRILWRIAMRQAAADHVAAFHAESIAEPILDDDDAKLVQLSDGEVERRAREGSK